MNFGDLPEQYSTLGSSKIVVLPVPYDGTSTWVKGADKGPQAIIEASGNMEIYDIETDSEVHLLGIHTANPVLENKSPEDMTKAVYKEVKKLLGRNKFVVTIGGEHSISIGAIQAHAEKFTDLTIIQIDAHADLRDEYLGSKYNHACVMARAREFAPTVQIGIRSMSVEESFVTEPGRIFYARDINQGETWKYDMLSVLSNNVYITFDLDALDPSIMPSTGTPEPGGLHWFETIEILRRISERSKIVGFDVVELCPNPASKASDFLAAKLIYKLLTYSFIDQIPKHGK
ncbi:MAG: agmatinase [Bacteroidales bacterium]